MLTAIRLVPVRFPDQVPGGIAVYDLVTRTSLPVPLFETPQQAEGFLQYVRDGGILDPFDCGERAIGSLHAAWRRRGSPDYRPDIEEMDAAE